MSLINELKDKHKGEECFILGCGPSLNQYKPEYIADKTDGATVFAIKQAFNYVPEIVDYHFLNSANYVRYNYKEHKPFRIGQFSKVEYYSFVFGNHLHDEFDEIFFVDNDTNFTLTLSHTQNFDYWTFDERKVRPWGPGIMYESVFFAAVHMGFSKLNTIGWDLGPPNSLEREHFYGDYKKTLQPANLLEPDESTSEIRLTKAWYNWMSKRGINLTIRTDNSYAHKDIPRAEL